MALSNGTSLRKNGKPVKKVWSTKLTKTDREQRYSTTYPLYFTGEGNTVWSLTDEKAPRSLDDAVQKATILCSDPDSPQTHCTVYELRAVHRVGVEFDWKAYAAEQQAASPVVKQGPTFRLHSTTASMPIQFPNAQVDSDAAD